MHRPSVFKSEFLTDSEIESLATELIDAEDPLCNHAEFLCHAARILFRYGTLKQKEEPLLLALNMLIQAEEIEPPLFHLTSVWSHLWGNIFIQLGRGLYDHSFIEKALVHYANAAKVTDCPPELYWDWAEGWLLLGLYSAEYSDLREAIKTFQKASSLGCCSFDFRIDYAIAYLFYGMHLGNPSYLDEAMGLLQCVITDTYDRKGSVSSSHARAWITYASLCQKRYYLTHLQEDFERAEHIFREAILTVPDQSDLWLEWAELALYSGWMYRDVHMIEQGLEKLTSSKIKECDPLCVSALLGRGFVCMGLLLDDLSLMQEGKKRVSTALELAPGHSELVHSMALVDFSFGVYFSDIEAHQRAENYLKKEIEKDLTVIENWYTLFQVYISQSIIQEERSLAKQALDVISRISSLRPHSAIYLNDWGEALLQLKQVEPCLDNQQAFLEEALLKFKAGYALCPDLDTLYNWGCTLDQLGDLTGDLENYREAVHCLFEVYQYNSKELHVCYHFALALAHHGELAANVEHLYEAVELFTQLADCNPDDDILLAEFGYTLLNLSELVYDPVNPEKGELLRKAAEKRLLHAVEIGNREANYHLACLYSLTGLVDASFRFLSRAKMLKALPPIGDLEHDEWLANVRQTKQFQKFKVS